MLDHTPEPWKGQEAYAEQDQITGPFYVESSEHTVVAEGLTQANAKRIVVCVNACRDMADPEREIWELRHRYEALEAEAAMVIACWDRGDLADAVNNLSVSEEAIHEAEALLDSWLNDDEEDEGDA